MPLRKALAACAVVLFASACIPEGYVKDPTPWLVEARWGEAERVQVAITEYAFTPQVLTFVKNRPYVLEIVNRGARPHVFAAEQFLKAVATRDARVPDVAGFTAPRFTAIEVAPGQRVELAFVAVRPGTYPLTCSAPGHDANGMSGAARIVPPPEGP